VKSAQVTVELLDGTTLSARTIMRDYVAYETTSKKQKPPWGGISDSPSRFESFVAWSALRREGKVDQPYEGFLDNVAQMDFDFDEDAIPTNGASGGD
jgi:hypothetical protein